MLVQLVLDEEHLDHHWPSLRSSDHMEETLVSKTETRDNTKSKTPLIFYYCQQVDHKAYVCPQKKEAIAVYQGMGMCHL